MSNWNSVGHLPVTDEFGVNREAVRRELQMYMDEAILRASDVSVSIPPTVPDEDAEALDTLLQQVIEDINDDILDVVITLIERAIKERT